MTISAGRKRGRVMDGLISRQAAIDAARDWYEGLICGSFKGLEKRLRALPSAQPERKKGKWIDETFKPWGLVYHPYKCDQCGEHSEADSNFCPNCGARMKGADDE